MEDLLPYYERELAFLRRYSREFAERYPKIAGRLLLVGDTSEDPHVERMIESFALMGARVSKKLDDDYPEFTESLLQVLYPHYLRPFPSCSIAHFDMGTAGSQLTTPVTVPRGTELHSRSVRGVQCRFRTAYEVELSPVAIQAARFKPVAQLPGNVRAPAQTCAQITLDVRLDGQKDSLAALGIDNLRLFIDGEPSMCAVLHDALAMNVAEAYVEPAATPGHWTSLKGNPLHSVGMREEESLIDMPARSHPAYRLLTEFFAFPEKFGFFDLDLTRAGAAGGKAFSIHFILSGVAADSTYAQLLDQLGVDNFKLGCTPVVNLFAQRAEPIHVSHRQVNYSVLADARRPWAYEVHSMDSVACVRQTEQGESVTEYRPFYSLRHGENPKQAEQYWIARRDPLVAEQSPGHELELSMVDLQFDPVEPSTDVLSCGITCTNRNLPTQLAYGVRGGDLTMEGGSVARAISLLRKPTPTRRFDGGRGGQWRLISHISLNHVSLVEGGVETLREMLRLYDLPRSPISASQIDGIVDLAHQSTTAWLTGRPFGSVVRGTEIRLSIDESRFVGTSIHAFADVLDHFFALYVHANSFTRFILVSSETGEELIRCPERSGESILV